MGCRESSVALRRATQDWRNGPSPPLPLELQPLLRLDPDLRCSFVLHIVAKYSHRDCAVLLNLEAESVKTLVQTALLSLSRSIASLRLQNLDLVPEVTVLRVYLDLLQWVIAAFQAALARVSPRETVLFCHLRSAASWHWIQRGAHGTAARRLGLIAQSQSMQFQSCRLNPSQCGFT